MRALAIQAVLIAVLTLTASAQSVSVSGDRKFTGKVTLGTFVADPVNNVYSLGTQTPILFPGPPTDFFWVGRTANTSIINNSTIRGKILVDTNTDWAGTGYGIYGTAATSTTGTGNLTRSGVGNAGSLVGVLGQATHSAPSNVAEMSGIGGSLQVGISGNGIVSTAGEAASFSSLGINVGTGSSVTTFAAFRAKNRSITGTLNANIGFLVDPMQSGNSRMAIRTYDIGYLGGGSQPGIHLYSELPACNQTFTGGLYGVFGTDGAEFTITDASTNIINASVSGGGPYSAPVRCDGAAGVYRVKSGATLNGINLGQMMLSYDTTSLARMFLTPLTANTGPTFSLVPTGTATGSTIGVRNSSDPNNYGHVRLSIVGTEARLILSAVGTGSAPTVFKFWTTSPIGAGLVMPTAADLKGGFQSDPYTPSSSTEPCTAGRFGPGADGNFYVCTATNTWKRVALSSF